ncbi:MAG TPA: DUF5694 domain-containing protein, partial [Acidimicrobiia bacterium]|nr:DUF5694 domain-containing protein [Acidimicrobiia bacterium]
PEVERLAASDPSHRRRYETVRSEAQRAAADQEAWLAAHSVGETLRRMNRPEALRDALALYVRHLAPIAEAPDYPGPDMVAAWYRRNLRILAHLHAVTGPGDRLLVVFGQGHVAVWHHLLALSDVFSVVDPEPWLTYPG